jgi:hypothetical protein
VPLFSTSIVASVELIRALFSTCIAASVGPMPLFSICFVASIGLIRAFV